MPDIVWTSDEKKDFDEMRAWWNEKQTRTLIGRVTSAANQRVKGWGLSKTIVFVVILFVLVGAGLWFADYRITIKENPVQKPVLDLPTYEYKKGGQQ